MDDADKEDIAKFAKNLGVDYPILVGKDDVGEAYGGVQFLPATFYVGRDGKLVDKVFGLKGRDEIEDKIKEDAGQWSINCVATTQRHESEMKGQKVLHFCDRTQ